MSCVSEVETSQPQSGRLLCGGSKAAVERMLAFGRELYSLSLGLLRDPQSSQMLQDAFSLLAYSNPWSSPVGWQLDPQQREPVCAALNSAILGEFQIICDTYLLHSTFKSCLSPINPCLIRIPFCWTVHCFITGKHIDCVLQRTCVEYLAHFGKNNIYRDYCIHSCCSWNILNFMQNSFL